MSTESVSETVDESNSFSPPKPRRKITSETQSRITEALDGDEFERKVVGDPVAEDSSSSEGSVELTDQEREWLRTLITVGRRERVVDILGHEVHIQSLKCTDELRIGLYTKPYTGTDFYARAYQVGTVAAGVKLIDGKPLVPQPLSAAGTASQFTEKAKIVEEFYPLTVSLIYEAVRGLDGEFVKLMEKLGKLDG